MKNNHLSRSKHCDNASTNGIAGLLISLITGSETAVPIIIGFISLYFPDYLFVGDRRRLQSGARLHKVHNKHFQYTPCINRLQLGAFYP